MHITAHGGRREAASVEMTLNYGSLIVMKDDTGDN